MPKFKAGTLYMTFRKYSKMVQNELNKQLLPYSLSSQHGNYLIALSDGEGKSIKEINEAVENDGALTTRILKKLTLCELVSITYKSARNCTVYLTEQGKKVAGNLIESLEHVKKSVFKKLSPIQMYQLDGIAKKII